MTYTNRDFEPTDVEQAAIARALRRLNGWGRDQSTQEAVARTALRILVAATITQPQDDPPLFASLPMPAWNQPSAAFPIVDRPLLNLLEVP